MDSVSIRVPYKNLKHNADAEVEMMSFQEEADPRIESDNSNRFSNGNGSNHSSSSPQGLPTENCSLITLILSCTVAAGVQFGWALQLSLLTPYIQTLGIGHAFSSFIWLCGPITGLVVQPCVGIWSDRCTSKYGRRRPFILVGSLMISIAVITIGFSADIGYLIGDTKEHCSVYKGTRTRAAFVFIIGFWMLDLANNTVQGPARALLADLAGPDQRNSANAIFCSWMAIGNILGFLSGSSGNWHRWFPFLKSRACCEACGNLKAAFLVAVIFLTFCTLVTLYFAKEIPLAPKQHKKLSDSSPLLNNHQQTGSENSDSKPLTNSGKSSEDEEEDQGCIQCLLSWLSHGCHGSLFSFLIRIGWGERFIMGDPKGDAAKVQAYDEGVREGAFGLLLNSVVLGISSFLIEPMCQWMGSRLVWALSNFVVFASMAGTAVITLISVKQSQGNQEVVGENEAIKNASLVIFAILGLPLAITYSVPFSVTAELTADTGGGQGLAIGVLNLAIVIPQMVVSLGAGPWDALFGGGNVPAFVLASVSALAAGVFASLKLPTLSTNSYKPTEVATWLLHTIITLQSSNSSKLITIQSLTDKTTTSIMATASTATTTTTTRLLSPTTTSIAHQTLRSTLSSFTKPASLKTLRLSTKLHVSSPTDKPISTTTTTKPTQETIFFDGGAHYGDLVANLLLGFTLVWLPLTLAAVLRGFFLRYRFTNLRVTVISGLTGQDRSDFSYKVVKDVQVVPRFIGEWGDVIITLKDGTKVDLRSVPKFREIAKYCLSMVEKKSADELEESGGAKGFESGLWWVFFDQKRGAVKDDSK
ncbi:unnamed protein product [Lactuca saligna]|uniref:Sucrose transport protein SUT3 n=1 Tax=Lactuca saligna TaxID=75948 RepID=A0AA36EI60_LACSI|nr:unnamed protein product [Lactuca saligna]